MLRESLRFDLSRSSITFDLTILELIDYAEEQFYRRFQCHMDSDIKEFTLIKIQEYLFRHTEQIAILFIENPTHCKSKLRIRVNGILSDLPKYAKYCINIQSLLELKNLGFYVITDSDRFFDNSDHDIFSSTLNY
jgi:5,10-methenyltetrahydromethanopterin hydrogenase